MARALRATPGSPQAVVVHGVARADELAYGDELSAWADRTPGWTYAPAISRPADSLNAGWSGRVGRLDAVVPDLIDELGLDLRASVAYLCGNPAMIAGLRSRLAALGVPSPAIRAEAY